MFQKNSLLIQKCTHFIWQEKYFCLQREEGHSGTYTSQVRNGFRQNYSSSVNFSPSLKARHSCTILSFLVRPASHNVSLESSKLNPLLWQTPCANQGQFWWFWSFGLIFFFHFRRKYLQSASLIFRVTLNTTWSFSPEIRKLSPMCALLMTRTALRYQRDQNSSQVIFLAYLTLLPKPRQFSCHFYHGICVHTWKKYWKCIFRN